MGYYMTRGLIGSIDFARMLSENILSSQLFLLGLSCDQHALTPNSSRLKEKCHSNTVFLSSTRERSLTEVPLISFLSKVYIRFCITHTMRLCFHSLRTITKQHHPAIHYQPLEIGTATRIQTHNQTYTTPKISSPIMRSTNLSSSFTPTTKPQSWIP